MHTLALILAALSLGKIEVYKTLKPFAHPEYLRTNVFNTWFGVWELHTHAREILLTYSFTSLGKM